MTLQEKHNYLLRFQRFQQNREKSFAPRIKRALNAQYSQFTSHIHSGLEKALDRIDPSGIAAILKDLYLDAGIVYGAKIRADLQKVSRRGAKGIRMQYEIKGRMPIGFSEIMRQLIADYFQTDILNTSQGITETTKDLIREVFTNAYQLGLGIDDIIVQLRNTELSAIRARMIARTETVKVANEGARFVAKQSGLKLHKEWLSANDLRVRGNKPEDKGNHVTVNGQVVDVDAYFTLKGGVTMLHPGHTVQQNGTDVPLADLINCRCCTLYLPID